MISKIKIQNIFCSVEAKASDLETDIRWQSSEVGFWKALFDSAPSESYRQGYSKKLIEAETKMDAINILKVKISERA